MQEILKEIDRSLALNADGFLIDPKVLIKAQRALEIVKEMAFDSWSANIGRSGIVISADKKIDLKRLFDRELMERIERAEVKGGR